MPERRYKYVVNDPSGGYNVERSIKAKVTARYDYVTDRGDYVATESYEERDIVHHGGRTWVCLKPAQGIAPGTDPAVWAEVGSGRGSKLVPDRSTIVILESKTAEMSVSAVDADGAPLPDITSSELYEWETDGATQTAQPNRISVEVVATDTLRTYTYTVRHESIAHGAQIHVYAVDLATLIQRKDTAKLNELLRVIGVSDPEAYARVVQALTAIKAPYIDKTTRTWWEWDAGQGKYVDTGVSAEGEAAYSVTLSSYERVIKEGGEGLRQELKVVTGDKQVMTQGKEVVTSQYSLSTHITVLRGSKELLYSDTVEEGAYTTTLRAQGLSASVNAGNIVVTSVGDKGGHVDIEVNCEGKAIITKRFSVVVVKDGVGRYTESRYMHSDTMPETPTGRHPKGWSKSSRSPRETISITDVRGFERQGESYVLDLINTDQGSIVHQTTEGEQYVTYHVKGQDHSGEGVYVRLFGFATAKTLYGRTLYGSFDETLRIHIPQGVRAVLSARGRRKASHEQTYTTVRLTRTDSSVCWETRAEITPSLHDIEGATVVPTWSTPTVYKTVTKRTRLTPSHVLSKLTSVGGYSPSSYTVAHVDDDNNLVRTSMVLYTSVDGLTWVRKEMHKDVSTMTVRVGADATYYKVRTYDWVDGNTSYTSGYLHESNGVVVGDGRNGTNGKDGKDGKAPRISADGYWEYWDGTKWVRTDIKAKGADGRVGAMPVPTGVYKQGREYYYNDHVRHVVLYRAPGDSRMYPYLVRNYSPHPITVPPTGHTDDPNWVRSNYMEFVATEVIMAEGGYIAEFIFRGGRMVSQRGLFEGREVDIADVPSDKVGAFVPNIALDGKRGDITIRGSVATPFEWDYSGDSKVKETIIISRDSYNRFNNVGLTFYAHENGKTIRIKNVHDKTVKLHLRMYLQALARDPSKGSEIVEVSIPPGAMLSGIIAPDVRTLQEYPNGVYQEIINGVLTNVGYIVGIHPITPMEETEETTTGYRKFTVGYTVTKPAKEIKVVAAGRVRGNGSHELKTGAFTGSSRDSLGAYTVYHSIGHTNYAPTVTAQAQSGTLVAMIKNLTANYFEVEISTDTGNYEDGAFSFSCVAEV